MYYRRKVILALLESFNGEISRSSLQPLLFLFTRYQQKPAFDFVPHTSGCFSFQVDTDLRTMIGEGMLVADDKKWFKADKTNYTPTLNAKDKQVLLYIQNRFDNHTRDELIAYIFRTYPFYALKCDLAMGILNETELKSVKESVAENHATVLYTIGYEGLSLEGYLNKLIQNNINLLVDVRKNPFSMKYGFSKNQLQKGCEESGIAYVHIPDLGIDSDKRKGLTTQRDYDELFGHYEQAIMTEHKKSVSAVFDLLKENERIALTCFEAHHCQCHRGILAKAITQLPDWEYELIHL